MNRAHELRSRGSARRAARRLLTLVLLAAVGVGAGYLGVRLRQAMNSGQLLEIRDLNVVGLKQVARADVLAYGNLRPGQGLYSFDLKQVEESIAQHPLIERVRLIRRPPHELRAIVVEQQPVAYVTLGRPYAVNARGQIFARAETLGGRSLPVITGLDPERFQADGDGTSTELREAMQVLGRVARCEVGLGELSEVRFDPVLGVSMVLQGTLGVVELGRGELGRKFDQLVQLKAHLDGRGQSARRVHLGDARDRRRVVVRLERREKDHVRQSGPMSG